VANCWHYLWNTLRYPVWSHLWRTVETICASHNYVIYGELLTLFVEHINYVFCVTQYGAMCIELLALLLEHINNVIYGAICGELLTLFV
jgi:hypothetical protein